MIPGNLVWNYFYNLKSENHSDDEDPIKNQHKNQIIKNDYVLRTININDLLKNDLDLKEFINSEFNGDDKTLKKIPVTSYGLIGDSSFAKDVIIDGYHRILQKLINGEIEFNVYVPLTSRFY